MPSRRSFLQVLSASLVLGLPKGKLLGDYVNGSLESGVSVYGNYGFGQDHFIGLDHFTTDAGEDTLLFSDYRSGVVRRLFRVSGDQYVMGPGFAVQAPVELTLRLLRDSKGRVLRISLRTQDGVERIGDRLPATKDDIVFQDGNVRLAGTLISPTTVGPHPAIILLHGSGPLTRSSFGPYPYFFSSIGLSVLIYDKRGTGASTGILMDASTGTLMKPDDYYPNDIANDALAAFRFLQTRKDIDQKRIGFWGSSEGGMLATLVAARNKQVAFAINSSGFMGPLWETLLYQVAPSMREFGYSEASIQDNVAFTEFWMRVARTGEGWSEFLKRQQAALKMKDFFFLQSSGKFTSLEQMRWDWSHIMTFNPLPSVEKVTCPVLGLFGELDSSTNAVVTAANMGKALSTGKNRGHLIKIFPKAGHSLAIMPSQNKMAPGVFETLRSWLLKHTEIV